MSKIYFSKANFVFFLFVFFLKTASGYSLETHESRIERLEQEVQELQEKLNEFLVDQAKPSANPGILGDVYFITFDALYWYTRTNGTAFAYSNSTTLTSLPLNSRTKDLNFGWEWGGRAGLGKNLDHDKWDVYGTFTFFRPHISGGSSAGLNTTLIPLKGATLINLGVSQAKSQYALDAYQVDVELGRHYFVSNKLSFRPFIGVKNAWMDQKQIVRYTGGAIGNHTAHIEDNCDYWGVGFRSGINSKWHLGDGFYLNGSLSGALLYGFFDIEHHEKLTSSSQNSVKINDNKHRFIPTAQWRFGLGWGMHVNQSKNYIDLGVAYEGQYWWRLNQMINIYETNAFRYDSLSEDVSMHGITFMARWYY